MRKRKECGTLHAMKLNFPLESLIGKPFVAYKNGKRREIGTITAARIHDDRIEIQAGIHDEELLGTINAKAVEGLSLGG